MPKITENTKNHQECQRSPIRLKITKYYHQLEILPKMQNNQKCRNWPNLKNITKNAKEPTISSNNSHQDLLSPENNRGECIHTSSLSQGQVFLCLHLHWCASQQLQSSPRLTPPWTEYIQNSSLKSSQGLPLSSSLLLCLLAATILTKTYSLLKITGVSIFKPHHLSHAKVHLCLHLFCWTFWQLPSSPTLTRPWKQQGWVCLNLITQFDPRFTSVFISIVLPPTI